ncbi:MarR family winged helix-turn-helix transcriptional regulator [Mycolicibacterium psychrotolerans]|uniref:MarR family winged helix-turn-helix transcriptional regulator n=1 Tax=Mycolicibacterium psychrotolerans TaxID=216929 RepID=UPI003D6641A9
MDIDLSPVVSASSIADGMPLQSAPFTAFVEWANSTRLRVRLMEQVNFPLPGDLSAFLVVNQLIYRGATRPSLLAEILESGASNVSKCVRRLEAADLVCRVADPVDDRAVLVALTDAGRALGEKILAVLAEDFAAALSDWSDTEIAVLQAVMTKLAASLTPLIEPGGATPAESRSAGQ